MPFPISIWARCRGCRAKSARRSRADWISSRRSGRRRPIPRRSGRRATRSTRPSARSRWSGSTPWSSTPTRSSGSCSAWRSSARTTSMPACACIDRACRKLVIFLDELVGGMPPVPLKLFPEYEAMQRSRGVKAAAATDLFFPDLRLRVPLPGAPLPLAPTKLASHLVKQRRVYQNGLLAFLRGESDGARQMRDAAAGMERVSAPGIGTGLLVDRRRVLRRHHRGWAGAGLRGEAARRAARPPDSPRRRRLGEGRRPGCGARCSITSP